MKIRTLLLALIVLFPCAAFAANKTVRDGSGNLLETWTKKGNRIEVRDQNNNLKEERRRVGDRIEVRDGSGNLIREESGD